MTTSVLELPHRFFFQWILEFSDVFLHRPATCGRANDETMDGALRWRRIFHGDGSEFGVQCLRCATNLARCQFRRVQLDRGWNRCVLRIRLLEDGEHPRSNERADGADGVLLIDEQLLPFVFRRHVREPSRLIVALMQFPHRGWLRVSLLRHPDIAMMRLPCTPLDQCPFDLEDSGDDDPLLFPSGFLDMSG